MDAFSRLLASIGQSLGRGLGQVGQTELEQRQRLEALEFQRKANISSQLLQTFTQLLQTQGIQEVEPGGIDAIKQAVTDLALGKIDSPAVQGAIEVFPRVAAAANKLTVYRELATKDLDALSRLVVNADPKEAQALLGAIGLGGMYEALRARGEILTEADRLGLQLTREKIDLMAAQRKEILDKLGPSIELLRTQARQADAATQKLLAETEALLMRLPLEIEKLNLDIENGRLSVEEARIRVQNLQREIDARIGEILSRTALNEAQREKVLADIGEVKARIENWLADTELKKAQARKVSAEAEAAEKALKYLETEYKLRLSKEASDLFKSALQNLIYGGRQTDPERIKNILRGIPGLDLIISDEETLNAMANSIAEGVRQFIYQEDLKISQEEAKAVDSAINAAMKAANPGAARELAMMMLPEGMRKEKREMIANAAAFVNVFATGRMTVDLIKSLTEITPPKESRSGLLRIIYDSLARMHDGTEEGKKQALARANAAVNTIKYIWSLNEETRDLQKLKLVSDVELNNARAAHERVLAQLEPKKLDLKWQEFKLDEWYKKEWIKINWAKLDLERLELQAKQAQVKDTVLQDLKTIADTANKLHDAAVGMLETRLRQLRFNNCANELNRVGSLTWLEAVRGKTGDECNEAVAQILNNPQDENNRKVIQAIEGAQNAKLRAISLFNAVISGDVPLTPAAPDATTPGGATPATPGTRGRPSGTAAPGGTTAPGTTPRTSVALSGTTRGALGSDFASGAKVAFNRLREFRVQIPNDPKLVGAMVFVYGTEFGPADNPFQVTEASGAKGVKKKLPNRGEAWVPIAPDKGFQEVIDADKPGARKKSLEIDSAIAFGAAWIFPNYVWRPGMLAKYIREDFRNSNPGLFRRADYFKSRTGEVDMVAVAAAYADMSLEKLGTPIRYTRAYTGLLRLLAQHDLDMLRMGKPLPPEQAKQRYLNMVKSDPKLLEAVRKQFPELDRKQAFERLLAMAENLYDATRLSNIGKLVLGGGR